MKTRLIAFGDSWTWGDELRDPQYPDLEWVSEPRNTPYRLSHGFAGLVAKHFSLQLENHASNGQSLQSMIWTFEWWLDNNIQVDDSLVLIGLTHPDRTSWWYPQRQLTPDDPAWYRYLHSIWLESESGAAYKGWHDFHKFWRVNSMNAELSRKNYQTAVYFFAGTCERLHIPYVMFNIFGNMPIVPFDPTINKGTGLMDQLNAQAPDRRFWAQQHPNESGHKAIADLLISHIESCKLVG